MFGTGVFHDLGHALSSHTYLGMQSVHNVYCSCSRAHTRTHMHTHAHMHAQTHKHTDMHTHMPARAHTHTVLYVQALCT